jgi:hypothetical protein
MEFDSISAPTSASAPSTSASATTANATATSTQTETYASTVTRQPSRISASTPQLITSL